MCNIITMLLLLSLPRRFERKEEEKKTRRKRRLIAKRKRLIKIDSIEKPKENQSNRASSNDKTKHDINTWYRLEALAHQQFSIKATIHFVFFLFYFFLFIMPTTKLLYVNSFHSVIFLFLFSSFFFAIETIKLFWKHLPIKMT